MFNSGPELDLSEFPSFQSLRRYESEPQLFVKRRHRTLPSSINERQVSLTQSRNRRVPFISERVVGSQIATRVETGQSFVKEKGVIRGVFLPSCENMWGIIIFLRYFYVVGEAGLLVSLAACFFAFFASFATVVSFSTCTGSGGKVSSSGPYEIISRTFGAPVGIAVGTIYLVGNIFLGVLETIGAVEILFRISDDFVFSSSLSPRQLKSFYGCGLLLILFLSLWLFPKVVRKTSFIFLAVLFVTLLFYFASLFLAEVSDVATINPLVTGFSIATLRKNLLPEFTEEAGFGLIMSIVFPPFCGVFCSANKRATTGVSARDLQLGTFSALIFSFFLYSTIMVLWAGTADRHYLTGKAGSSFVLGRRLAGGEEASYVMEELGWPNALVLRIGIIIAAIGQSISSYLVAYHVFTSIVRDEHIFFFHYFRDDGKLVQLGKWIPIFGLAFILVLFSDINSIPTTLSICFLLCFLSINASCGLLSFLQLPSWRPYGVHKKRFRYIYLLFAVAGVVASGSMMFLISTTYSLIFFALGIVIFLGSFLVSIGYSQVGWTAFVENYCIQSLIKRAVHASDDFHAVNWHARLLLLHDCNEDKKDNEKLNSLLNLGMQVGDRGGHFLVVGIVSGDSHDSSLLEYTQTRASDMQKFLLEKSISGLTKFSVQPSFYEGCLNYIDASSLTVVHPNICLLPWLGQNRLVTGFSFMQVLQRAMLQGLSLILPYPSSQFPNDPTQVLSRGGVSQTVDIWWMTNDRGLIIFIGWLLHNTRVWRYSKLRVFVLLSKENETMLRSTKQLIEATLKKYRLTKSDTEVEIVVVKNPRSILPYEIAHFEDDESYDSDVSEPVEKTERQRQAAIFRSIRVEYAIELNQMIQRHSQDSGLLLVNLPDLTWWKMPQNLDDFAEDQCINWLNYCETIVRGLQQVLFVHGD